jgi:hypothetical protein
MADALIATPLPYGAFMLGFDFHLTKEGPRLIEINTNAGGLTTVILQSGNTHDQAVLRLGFVKAVCLEYYRATGRARPQRVAIVDAAVTTQGLYTEMQQFALLLQVHGIPAIVVSPEDLVRDEASNKLVYALDREPVDMMLVG